MLKGLLVGLKKASDATAVRKAATKARKAVRENSKIKGSEEKDALAEISAMANKLIESKTKKVYDGKREATPESVKGAVKGERSKARADAAKASSKTGKDGTQKPIGKVRMSTVDAFMIAADGNMKKAEQLACDNAIKLIEQYNK